MSEITFPSRFGKYILLEQIASGGMAQVYRAKVTGEADFQRLVAIKCMLPHLARDAQFTTMFKDEAKLAANLTHTNIAHIYELGSIEERLYIAMELINGRDLRHIMRTAKKRRVPIPFGFAAYVLSKTAEGLDYAHKHRSLDGRPLNLVHRDVSPQNVLVSYHGEVKVVDFGIAKAEQRDTETNAGVLKGKFAYMAPEQVMGADLDCRSDIFSLGSVLFEMVTGQKLFTGDSDVALLEKVRNANIPLLADIMPSAPAEFDEILGQALAQEADNRFSSASEFAESLQPLMIEDRAIFGARQSAQFMAFLYGDEIEHMNAKYRTFATLRADSLVSAEQGQKSEIFETAFAKDDGGNIVGPPQRGDDAGAPEQSAAAPDGKDRRRRDDPLTSEQAAAKPAPSPLRVEPTSSREWQPPEVERLGLAPKMLLAASSALVLAAAFFAVYSMSIGSN